jgi:hypothetical protein
MSEQPSEVEALRERYARRPEAAHEPRYRMLDAVVWRAVQNPHAASIDVRHLTLAPPIARAFCRLHPALYTLCNALPSLRTHLLCWIVKPLP